MTQWEKLQRLDSVYLQRLDELYGQDEFPMDVRHYLAHWIETQDWVRAMQDPSVASVLFQVLLENLDNQHSRFLQEADTFLLQRNFRRFKQNFQGFQEDPCYLAKVIQWFLEKEQEILQSALLAEQSQDVVRGRQVSPQIPFPTPLCLMSSFKALDADQYGDRDGGELPFQGRVALKPMLTLGAHSHAPRANHSLLCGNGEKEWMSGISVAVQLLQVQQNPMETDSQRCLDRKIEELRGKEMEHHVKSLEDQQDEFDFKYKTHMMEGNANEKERKEEMRILQELLNRLDTSRKALLGQMSSVLDLAEELLSSLVGEELPAWRRRQQKACIGAPDSVCLQQLERWFTVEAESLFQLRKLLKKLEELMGKVTYEGDPFKTQKPALQKRGDTLLNELLKSAFIVETQPSMPQGKGPLVLRTNVQFSVKTRLLVKVPELNHSMKVTVAIDRDAQPVKGYRRFNVLGNSSKALNMAECTNGGMVADFRHLTLKEQKAGNGGKGMNDGTLSVTEELHIISFETHFEWCGVSVRLETSTLPVVIISGASQQQNGWASVLWFNMLCTDPKNIEFFNNSSTATWPQLAEMLSWQFLSMTKRGLDSDQLSMIAQKLFGKQQNYDSFRVTWARFSKENLPGLGFSFWLWFDGILVLVKNFLEKLWKDGYIMGFVSKGKEKVLLKKKQDGTFLLRFSESSRDGAITFSWVEYSVEGKPSVRSVQPFTREDLKQIPLPEIIRNFQILVAENVPENPLKYLYPNIPKDEAFGKYYSHSNRDEKLYKEYLKHKLVFVSSENTVEAQPSVDTTDTAQDPAVYPEGVAPMSAMSPLCDVKNGDADAAGLTPSDVLMFDQMLSLPDHPVQVEGTGAPSPQVDPGTGVPDCTFLLDDPFLPGDGYVDETTSPPAGQDAPRYPHRLPLRSSPIQFRRCQLQGSGRSRTLVVSRGLGRPRRFTGSRPPNPAETAQRLGVGWTDATVRTKRVRGPPGPRRPAGDKRQGPLCDLTASGRLRAFQEACPARSWPRVRADHENIREGDGVGGRQRGTTLPPVHPAPRQALSCELHRGSQERYQELVRRARTPRSPNQIYRVPLTDSQRYGWWLSGSGQPGSEGSEPWTWVRRFPQRHSEMTKFVKSMSMTHREFSLH
ncbi:STAT3 protein, partial [Atractosteus spatula]|nr:STAT3 protein [Atractosteus spatula]